MLVDDFIYLVYVHLTIYIHFVLISLVVFEKQIIQELNGNLKDAFFDYSDQLKLDLWGNQVIMGIEWYSLNLNSYS